MKKLLAECFFIGIGQKMSYARAFFAVLRLELKGSGTKNRWVWYYYASARNSLVGKRVSDDSNSYLCGRK